ncbi:MAG: tRNA-dihydrouridine synthase family protein [Oligoflexus sp.]|nr:tRNA-dihydrouridine synthase family protein [Oligoflexus sp.]
MEASRLNRLGIDFPFMVAPMVGLTHVAFRAVVRHFTPKSVNPLLFTEMLSTRRLPFERIDRVDELKIMAGERYFIPQILGNEETFIQRSIQKLMPLEPWGLDINMGCPARQHLQHNWGVRLLGDRDYAARVVEMTKKHSTVPVSVKMRCGQDVADPQFLDDFTAALESAGADWLTIHARLQSQKHKGDADWNLVGDLRQKRSIPIVMNGDIQTAQDALSIYQSGQADGIMIGRAATARPWILWQIAHALGHRESPEAFPGMSPPQTPEEEGRFFLMAMVKFIDSLDQYFDNDDKNMRRLRFYVINAHKWFLFGHSYYSKCMKARTLTEARRVTEEMIDTVNFPMTSRINFF